MKWKFDRVQAKREARAALSGAHPHVMLVTLAYALVTIAPIVAVLLIALPTLTAPGAWAVMATMMLCALLLAVILYSMAAQVGYFSYILRLSRGEEAGFWCLLEGFAQTGRVLATVLALVFRLLPWLVLLVVLPVGGSLAMRYLGGAGVALMVLCELLYLLLLLWLCLRYALVWFLVLDYPDQGCNWAISRSIEAMKGRKWAFFKLILSFLGWQLLSGMTLGILGLWVTPYLLTAMARFYEGAVHPGEEAHLPLTF